MVNIFVDFELILVGYMRAVPNQVPIYWKHYGELLGPWIWLGGRVLERYCGIFCFVVVGSCLMTIQILPVHRLYKCVGAVSIHGVPCSPEI